MSFAKMLGSLKGLFFVTKFHEFILKRGFNMQNNVINFERLNFKKPKTPVDLLSIKEFAKKHEMKQGTLYKLAERGSIPRYKRGIWK